MCCIPLILHPIQWEDTVDVIRSNVIVVLANSMKTLMDTMVDSDWLAISMEAVVEIDTIIMDPMEDGVRMKRDVERPRDGEHHRVLQIA